MVCLIGRYTWELYVVTSDTVQLSCYAECAGRRRGTRNKPFNSASKRVMGVHIQSDFTINTSHTRKPCSTEVSTTPVSSSSRETTGEPAVSEADQYETEPSKVV